MHERFSNYLLLYSGRYFGPHLPEPEPADPLQRAIFFLGLLMMFVMLPVTLPLVFALMRKVSR